MKKKTGQTVIAIILLAALLYLADVRATIEAFSNITLEVLGILIFLSFALIYVSAFKWKLFIDASSSNRQLSVFKLFNFYLIGYFVNLILPSYIGGDAVRSWYAGKRVGQHEAFGATILERYTGLIAMVSLGIVAVIFSSQVPPSVTWVIIGLAFALISGTIFVLSPLLISIAEKIPYIQKHHNHLSKVQIVLKDSLTKPKLLLGSLSLSLIFHSLTVVNTAVAGEAVGWSNAPLGGLFVILPVVLLIGSLPLSPSGLGLQEGAFFVFLQTLGATPAQSLGVGLLLRAKSYLLALLGWIAWIVEKRGER